MISRRMLWRSHVTASYITGLIYIPLVIHAKWNEAAPPGGALIFGIVVSAAACPLWVPVLIVAAGVAFIVKHRAPTVYYAIFVSIYALSIAGAIIRERRKHRKSADVAAIG
jgi:hypothetical protein